METELIGKFQLGDGWQCNCGKVFFLAGDFFAEHWLDQFHFHCSRCRTKYSFNGGELRATIPAPEFAESPY